MLTWRGLFVLSLCWLFLVLDGNATPQMQRAAGSSSSGALSFAGSGENSVRLKKFLNRVPYDNMDSDREKEFTMVLRDSIWDRVKIHRKKQVPPVLLPFPIEGDRANKFQDWTYKYFKNFGHSTVRFFELKLDDQHYLFHTTQALEPFQNAGGRKILVWRWSQQGSRDTLELVRAFKASDNFHKALYNSENLPYFAILTYNSSPFSVLMRRMFDPVEFHTRLSLGLRG